MLYVKRVSYRFVTHDPGAYVVVPVGPYWCSSDVLSGYIRSIHGVGRNWTASLST